MFKGTLLGIILIADCGMPIDVCLSGIKGQSTVINSAAIGNPTAVPPIKRPGSGHPLEKMPELKVARPMTTSQQVPSEGLTEVL